MFRLLKKHHKQLSVAVISLSACVIGAPAANANAARGLEIMKELDGRDQGWTDQTAEMTMVLTNRQGKQSKRKIRVKNLEVRNDGDKGLTIFDSPRDVKGTAFLTFSHVKEPDDQWIFLPALKRVKRISSNNKSGPFMGSEFAYEDISSFELGKYQYNYLKDDTINNEEAFVVEMKPTYKHSGYTKLISWVDKSHYRIQKTVYYDRKGSKLKTLSFKNYKQFLSQYWRPGVMHMENHQTGKKTTLSWKNYKFKTGLKESDFSQSKLKRAR